MALNQKKTERLRDHLDEEGSLNTEDLRATMRLPAGNPEIVRDYLAHVVKEDGTPELLERYDAVNDQPAKTAPAAKKTARKRAAKKAASKAASKTAPKAAKAQASTDPDASMPADAPGPRGAKGQPGKSDLPDDPDDGSALAFADYRFSVRDPDTNLQTALEVRTVKKNRVILQPIPQAAPPDPAEEPTYVQVLIGGERLDVPVAELRASGPQFTLHGVAYQRDKLLAAVELALA